MRTLSTPLRSERVLAALAWICSLPFNAWVNGQAYDAIVVGGGPGGSTAATYLARAGRRALLLEKEIFPRFHIGESLLPYNTAIFEEMGVAPALEKACFPQKFGAQFYLGNGSKANAFVFRNGCYTRQWQAIQVERATFDHILLNHARESGADVREGWSVQRVEHDETGARVDARSPQGELLRFEGKFLIDASGRNNLTGNQQNLRQMHPHLRKLAVFGHFTGVRLDPGERGGDTVIIRLANKWFWIIPVTSTKTSVGCVMDAAEYAAEKKSPEMIFNRWVASSSVIRERMKSAELVGPMHATSDFSYINSTLIGPRLARVGDAAGFLDPIFSSGVYIAMHSARDAARAVLAGLKGGHDGHRQLAAYQKKMRAALGLYWRMVEGFYTTPFMEVFMEPRNVWNLPAAVNAVLAGEVANRWCLRWRLNVFFWLVKLQARRPFLPRIHFS